MWVFGFRGASPSQPSITSPSLKYMRQSWWISTRSDDLFCLLFIILCINSRTDSSVLTADLLFQTVKLSPVKHKHGKAMFYAKCPTLSNFHSRPLLIMNKQLIITKGKNPPGDYSEWVMLTLTCSSAVMFYMPVYFFFFLFFFLLLICFHFTALFYNSAVALLISLQPLI